MELRKRFEISRQIVPHMIGEIREGTIREFKLGGTEWKEKT